MLDFCNKKDTCSKGGDDVKEKQGMASVAPDFFFTPS